MLKDDDKKHDIQEIEPDTKLYSGYIWKCMIPRQWIEEADLIGLSQVYFVWGHTNFAAKDALNYNLASLHYKESLIEKKHRKQGGLILLQKSHGEIVPGDPKWPVEDFYKLLVYGEKVKVSLELLSHARSRPQH